MNSDRKCDLWMIKGLHLRDNSTGGAMTARRTSLGHHINEMCQIIILQNSNTMFRALNGAELRWSYELCLQGAISDFFFFFELPSTEQSSFNEKNWSWNLKLSRFKLKQRLVIAVTHLNGFYSNMSLNLMRLWFKRCKLLKKLLNQERV